MFLSLWFKFRGCQSWWVHITAQSFGVMTDLFIYSPCTWLPATYSVSRLITWKPCLYSWMGSKNLGSFRNWKQNSGFHRVLSRCQTMHLPSFPHPRPFSSPAQLTFRFILTRRLGNGALVSPGRKFQSLCPCYHVLTQLKVVLRSTSPRAPWDNKPLSRYSSHPLLHKKIGRCVAWAIFLEIAS